MSAFINNKSKDEEFKTSDYDSRHGSILSSVVEKA
jgi:hypothetical protein